MGREGVQEHGAVYRRFRLGKQLLEELPGV